MTAASPLSNMQLELLKVFSADIAEADLVHIKQYLAKYFVTKAIAGADEIWEQKGFDNDTIDMWLSEA